MTIKAKATISAPAEREVTLVMGERAASILLALLYTHIGGVSDERNLLSGGVASIGSALQAAGIKQARLRVSSDGSGHDQHSVLFIEGLAY